MICMVLIFLVTGLHSGDSSTIDYPDCNVVQHHSVSDLWSYSEYLIVANKSYVINVTCRCSLERPVWTGTNGNMISSSDVYCYDNGISCEHNYISTPEEGLYVFTDLTNYKVNESTILQCGNIKSNFAKALVILISPIYTATSCSQTPSLLHSPTPSLIPSLSFSPSLSPMSSSSLSFFHPSSSLPPSQSFPSFMTTLTTPSSGKSSPLFTEYEFPLIVSTKRSTVVTVTNVITIMNTVNTSTATNIPDISTSEVTQNEDCVKENYLIMVVLGIAIPMMAIITILSILLCVAVRRMRRTKQ